MSRIGLDIVVNDKTAAALGNINKRIQGIDKEMSSINDRGRLLVKTLAGIATGYVVKSIISTTARFQDLRIALNAVTGSAEEGQKAFDYIRQFATTSIFTVDDLTNTFIKLQSSGITPSTKLLTMFQDVASVTSDRMGTLQAITDLYSRTTAGGLGLVELQRLGDRGIPVFEILSEKLGIARRDVAKFGQSMEGAQKILRALEEGFEERFGGATAALSGNLSQAFSNLEDAVDNAKYTLGEQFAPVLRDLVLDITDFIVKNDDLIKQLGEGIGLGLDKTIQFMKGLGDELAIVKDALNDVVAGYNALPDFVKELGIIGALLVGWRGKALIVAIVGIIGSISRAIDDVMDKDFTIDPGLEGEERLKEINKQMKLLDERLAEAKEIQIDFIRTPGGEMSIDDLGLGVLEDINKLQKIRMNLDMDAFQTSMALVTASTKKTESTKKEELVLGELTEETIKNTDAIKGNKDIIEGMLKPYDDLAEAGKRLIVQDIGTPVEEARKEYDKIKRTIIETERAMSALDPTLKEERDLLMELKANLPGLNDSLAILDERILDLAAMESPFYQFGQHIQEQADMIKQLGTLSSQVYDRMANDLTDFVMTGKFNFADFSRFVIRELVKIAVQAALTFAIKSIAGSFGFAIPGLAEGGPVRKGNPYIVGEEGPELFVPNSSGSILPNGQTTQSISQTGEGDVNVNFNITTVDATGFDELLVSRRATIVGIINEGLNRQGKRALI